MRGVSAAKRPRNQRNLQFLEKMIHITISSMLSVLQPFILKEQQKNPIYQGILGMIDMYLKLPRPPSISYIVKQKD